MELYLQWITVGVIVAACLYRVFFRRRRGKPGGDDCCSGCSGCSLKNNCSERRD